MTTRDRTVTGIYVAVVVVVLLLRATGALATPRSDLAQWLDPGIEASPGLLVVAVEGAGLLSAVPPELRERSRFLAPDGTLTLFADAAILDALHQSGAAAVAFTDVRPTAGREPAELAAMADAVARAPGTVVARVDAVARGTTSQRATPRLVGGIETRDALQAHTILIPEDGGNVRRSTPIRIQVGNERFLSAGIAAVAAADGTTRATGDSSNYLAAGLPLGDRLVPDGDGDGNLRIRWATSLVEGVPGTDGARAERVPSGHWISGAELLSGAADNQIRGRIVLVGSVDPLGAAYVVVPGGPQGGIPEVFAHANVANTLLQDAAPVEAPGSLDVGLVIAMGALGAGLVGRGRLRRGTIGLVLAAAAWPFASRAAIASGLLLDPLHPWLALLLAGLGALVFRQLTEARQRRLVEGLFASYVPPEVAAQLVQEGDLERHLVGERLDVTVFFCDLRGFTAQAATLEPSQVRDLLNLYYRRVTTAVLDNGGTVMQYVGDEVFAVFGAPLARDDHAAAAIRAALASQGAVPDLDRELAQQGLPPIRFGIGLNAGPVVAAHVGDQDTRRQYSVIGDTVNVGARLCSRAAPGEVVVSGAVRDGSVASGTTTISFELLEHVPMKGVERPVEVLRISTVDP